MAYSGIWTRLKKSFLNVKPGQDSVNKNISVNLWFEHSDWFKILAQPIRLLKMSVIQLLLIGVGLGLEPLAVVNVQLDLPII